MPAVPSSDSAQETVRSTATTDPSHTLNMQKPSSKSYAHAVSLSAIFGFVGVQHFYLGRHVEGLVDVWLTATWIYCFFVWDKPVLGIIALGADLIHAFVVTIMLLTGNFKDGEGRIVCYPGQELS